MLEQDVRTVFWKYWLPYCFHSDPIEPLKSWHFHGILNGRSWYPAESLYTSAQARQARNSSFSSPPRAQYQAHSDPESPWISLKSLNSELEHITICPTKEMVYSLYEDDLTSRRKRRVHSILKNLTIFPIWFRSGTFARFQCLPGRLLPNMEEEWWFLRPEAELEAALEVAGLRTFTKISLWAWPCGLLTRQM